MRNGKRAAFVEEGDLKMFEGIICNGGFGRKGMAGLIVTVLVLGMMMSVATNLNIVVWGEMRGGSARKNARMAYFAAVSGIHFTLNQLRADSVNTHTAAAASRLYLAPISPDNTVSHWCTWLGADKAYTISTGEKVGNNDYRCSSVFTVVPNSVDVDATKSKFVLCSYPGGATTGDSNDETKYWVKSQGIYVNQDNVEFRSQVWAYFEINNTAKTVTLKKFQPMGVQTLTVTAGTTVNDFWDWENF